MTEKEGLCKDCKHYVLVRTKVYRNPSYHYCKKGIDLMSVESLRCQFFEEKSTSEKQQEKGEEIFNIILFISAVIFFLWILGAFN